jgi:hypothetical protein
MAASQFEEIAREAAEKARRAKEEQERARANGHAHADGEAKPLEPLLHYRGEGYRAAPRRDMLVKGLMGAGELSVTYGQAKVGKSFLITDLALAVAAAVDRWFGHRIKRQGFVLYCIMEGAGGYPNRLQAWSQRHNRPVPDNFVWVPVRLRFVEDGTDDAAAEDVRRLKALVEQIKAETGLPCVLIVVDTAARAMTGCDENSAQDMGRFLDQCAELQSMEDRPHVCVIHHENAAGSKARGSTALLGGGDTFIHVTRDGKDRSWTVQWAKDDGEGTPHGFDLQAVELGEDEDGDQVRSCAVAATDGTPDDNSAAGRRKLGPVEKVVHDALLAAIVDHPDSTPRAHDVPSHVRGVTMERWHDYATRYLPQPTVKHKNEAFNRASQKLIADRIVNHVAGFVWTKP